MATATNNCSGPVVTPGLDRTKISSSGQVELVSVPSAADSDSTQSQEDEQNLSTESSLHNAQPAKSKRKRLLVKTKKKLHIGKDEQATIGLVLADATDTHSDSRLGENPPEPKKHTAKDLLHHPLLTVQSKIAGQGGHQIASNLVAKEISHGTDVEAVKAQAEVEKQGTEKQRNDRKRALQLLLKERQDMYVRWTMDRHVTKIRVLPVGTVPKRSKADFKKTGSDGTVTTDWESFARHTLKYNAQKYGSQYIGYNSNPPTPSKETMLPAVERLLVASAPLQTLIMSVRRVYRWDNRNETLKYLIVYSILWIFDLVFPGCLAALIFFILRRRLYSPTINHLQEDIKRTEDLTETALTLSEFIEKKGDQNWVDPLVQDVGPWAMLQIADLANLMETLKNFYEWRVPSQTAATLGLITLGLLVASFIPIRLIMRISTLIGGFSFFALFPIGSHFPEYRLLVSPMKWVFWNIPTHAEWSIATLQAEGQRHRGTSLPARTKSETETLVQDPMGYRGRSISHDREVSDQRGTPKSVTEIYGSYSCSHNGKNGKLLLDALGVRFVSSISHAQHFFFPYDKIVNLEKEMRIVTKGLSKNSGEDLKLTIKKNEEYLVLNMVNRDQAFSQIVGFSSTRWQVVW